MSSQTYYGDFVEQKGGEEYLVIHFSSTSRPIQERWRNNGLSADFLAEYWATFFPAHDVSSQKRQQEIKGVVNYIANELLENLMKFSYRPVEYPVGLGLYLYEDEFRFYASNAIDPESVEDFQARIQRMLTEDPQQFYLRQIEKNMAEDNARSQLGLLTMINDYKARLAWKFETLSPAPKIIVVTTMIQWVL